MEAFYIVTLFNALLRHKLMEKLELIPLDDVLQVSYTLIVP